MGVGVSVSVVIAPFSNGKSEKVKSKKWYSEPDEKVKSVITKWEK